MPAAAGDPESRAGKSGRPQAYSPWGPRKSGREERSSPGVFAVGFDKLRADTDSNYTAILSIWDRLFGSANSKEREIGMPIGVEGQQDQGFFRLLIYPFMRRD